MDGSSISPSSARPVLAPTPQPTVVSIVLNTADQSFGNSGSWQYGATGGAMSTPDNGKTWNFTTLNVPTTPIS
ncbi:hypothetical protein LA080_010919 [Diaporthe eres]|nr:hypothetical protein LA080_010919 [Diaporthe eres]